MFVFLVLVFLLHTSIVAYGSRSPLMFYVDVLLSRLSVSCVYPSFRIRIHSRARVRAYALLHHPT